MVHSDLYHLLQLHQTTHNILMFGTQTERQQSNMSKFGLPVSLKQPSIETGPSVEQTQTGRTSSRSSKTGHTAG